MLAPWNTGAEIAVKSSYPAVDVEGLLIVLNTTLPIFSNDVEVAPAGQ